MFFFSLSSNNRRTIVLPPQNYVYYTWLDPLKPRELVILCGSKKTELALIVSIFVELQFLFETYDFSF
jgi:hypothetical protein